MSGHSVPNSGGCSTIHGSIPAGCSLTSAAQPRLRASPSRRRGSSCRTGALATIAITSSSGMCGRPLTCRGPSSTFIRFLHGRRWSIDTERTVLAQSREPGTHTFTAQCGPLTASGTLTMPTPNGEDQLPLVFANRAPVLTSLVAKAGTIVVAGAPRNSAVTLVANVTDPDGDKLHFTWAVNAGSIGAINDNTAQWILPDSPGIAFAYVLVTDGKGAFREGSTVISTDAGIVPAPPAGAGAGGESIRQGQCPRSLSDLLRDLRHLFVFPAKNAALPAGRLPILRRHRRGAGLRARRRTGRHPTDLQRLEGEVGSRFAERRLSRHLRQHSRSRSRARHARHHECEWDGLLRLQLPACAGRAARYKSPQRAAGREPRRLRGHGAFAARRA